MSDFTFDRDRASRIGLDEAIFCAGKSAGQIAAILEGIDGRDVGVLLTRLDPFKFDDLPKRLRSRLDFDLVSHTAIFGEPRASRSGDAVAIVMAGTSDVPVGREAGRTLAFNGQLCRDYVDIGVAGLWRFLDRLDDIRQAPVVIVVAGMDAALVSVAGGLIGAPIIAVPTSVGYGVATGGSAALHATLASCAPGIAVMNIDNGYGAACAALRILNLVDAAWRAEAKPASARSVTP